jgi:hypothetical protein
MSFLERRVEVLKKQIEEQEQIIREEKMIKNLMRREIDKRLNVVENKNPHNLTNQNYLINLFENKINKNHSDDEKHNNQK